MESIADQLSGTIPDLLGYAGQMVASYKMVLLVVVAITGAGMFLVHIIRGR